MGISSETTRRHSENDEKFTTLICTSLSCDPIYNNFFFYMHNGIRIIFPYTIVIIYIYIQFGTNEICLFIFDAKNDDNFLTNKI